MSTISDEWLIGICTGLPFGAAIACFVFAWLVKADRTRGKLKSEVVGYDARGRDK